LQRTSNASTHWTLHIPVPQLNHAVLYTPGATAGSWNRQLAGSLTAVRQWTHPALYPDFNFSLPADQPQLIYLQLRHFKPDAVPLRFATAQHRQAQRALEFVGIGILLGAIFMLLTSTSIHFAQTRNRVDMLYIAFTGVMSLVLLNWAGASALWLWPGLTTWSHHAYAVLPLLSTGATLLFARHVCSLDVGFVWLNRLVLLSATLCLPLALLQWVADPVLAHHLVAMYLGFGTLLVLIANALTWRRLRAIGKWLFAAYLPQGLCTLLIAVQMAGFFGHWWELRYALLLAMTASIPLILQAFQIRTGDRRDLQVRANALQSQDALTGLLVKKSFLTEVSNALDRARHGRASGAIVLVDVVNYTHLRRLYGDAVGEQCLLRAVVKLHRVLRDVDPAGRIDTARFGLILEGVANRQAMNERMVRLIGSGLIPLPGLQPEVTLQFHVACVLLSDFIPPDDSVIPQLEDVLNGISPRSRRPIRFLESPHTEPKAPDANSTVNGDDIPSRSTNERPSPTI
jgi:diguanylate cyclase (GGDEF)-like protein